MRKTVRLVILNSSMLLLLLAFQNCGPIPALNSESSSTSPPPASDSGQGAHILPEQNYLKEAAPDLICGEAGYGYLMRNYLVKNCGACHDNTGISFPHFANSFDVKASYDEARGIPRKTFISTATDNRFCGAKCSISVKGETYKALLEWLDHQTCPL